MADARTVAELLPASVDFALGDGEGDWTAVTALQFAGSEEVLDGALAFCRSHDPRVRARGLDILGQLGVPVRTHPNACIKTAVQVLERDHDPRVLESAAIALMHLGPGAGTSALVGRAAHPDAGVRRSVAMALGGSTASEAILTLITLSGDNEASVRNWATFELGVQGDVDSPSVREALLARLDDDCREVRFEALRGLAKWGDLRVIGHLVAALKATPEDIALQEPAESFLGIAPACDDTPHVSVSEMITKLEALAAERSRRPL